ncbi:MAG TPA: SIR2 family protein, partial [Kofleriaceae bacterium]|nr:SIR2 family protein [Kofleriaceae bacterium]
MIAKLKEDLAHGRVVTVVGTGVSLSMCFDQRIDGQAVASWSGLLRHGVQACKHQGIADDADAALLLAQIESGKTDFLISAAENISMRLKKRAPGVFRGWLKDTIGQLKVNADRREVIEAVVALPGLLATLNYDNLLEAITGRQPVSWNEPDEVQEVLRGTHDPAVLHLHGHYRDPDSVVLGLRSYLEVRDHPHAKAVLELFTIGHTLLFVGCKGTSEDPNFIRLIDWAHDAHADVSPRHYMLCTTPEFVEFRRMLERAPWLQPLDYGADHDQLGSFLRSLLPEPARAPQEQNPRKSEPHSGQDPPPSPVEIVLPNPTEEPTPGPSDQVRLPQTKPAAHNYVPEVIVSMIFGTLAVFTFRWIFDWLLGDLSPRGVNAFSVAFG